MILIKNILNEIKMVVSLNYIKMTSYIQETSFNPANWNQDYVNNTSYFAQDYTEEV